MNGELSVELWVDVDSNDADDLASLAEWLRDEPELSSSLRVHRTPIKDGTMGGAVELIMAIGSLGLTKAFVTVMVTWLKTRGSDVRVLVRNANGRQLEVSADHVGDPAELVRRISELEEPDGDDSAATA
jgi:hypothetical protein